jgi:hypothetical protein
MSMLSLTSNTVRNKKIRHVTIPLAHTTTEWNAWMECLMPIAREMTYLKVKDCYMNSELSTC